MKNADGLKWIMPKTDRLQLTTGALSTRYIIHESSKQRRDGREYMRQKPYARIVARLSSVPSNYADVIPPFNPFKLYASNKPVTANDEDESAGSGLSRSDVSVKVVELLGGILPEEDGQEIDTKEAQDLIEHSAGVETPGGAEGGAAGADVPLDGVAAAPQADAAALSAPSPASPEAGVSEQPNTTSIAKAADAFEDVRRRFRGRRGDGRQGRPR